MAQRWLAKHLKNKVISYLTAYMDNFPMDSRLKSKNQVSNRKIYWIKII